MTHAFTTRTLACTRTHRFHVSHHTHHRHPTHRTPVFSSSPPPPPPSSLSSSSSSPPPPPSVMLTSHLPPTTQSHALAPSRRRRDDTTISSPTPDPTDDAVPQAPADMDFGIDLGVRDHSPHFLLSLSLISVAVLAHAVHWGRACDGQRSAAGPVLVGDAHARCCWPHALQTLSPAAT
jgi:hypothetical protein